MLTTKLAAIAGVSMLVATLQDGCPTSTDPKPLSFQANAGCAGSVDDTRWLFNMETSGWAVDAPYVVVYDNPDWYDDPTWVWSEVISFDLLEQGGDDVDGDYYQKWRRDDVYYVASLDEYVDDVNSLFQCQNFEFLTYVFYATDYFYGGELCAAMGYDPEFFAPECAY